MTYHLDAIGHAVPGGLARLIRRDGEVIGRILDLTPYVKVQPGPPAGSWKNVNGTLSWVASGGTAAAVQGTDPRLRLFEAQTLNGHGYEEGPRFRQMELAYEWITDEPYVLGSTINVTKSLLVAQKPPAGQKWLRPTPTRKRRQREKRR